MSGTSEHGKAVSGGEDSTSTDTGLNQLLQLLSQAVKQGGAAVPRSTGPSLRDLPKDAFRLPEFSGERSGNDRIRPSHVRTFLRKLDKYLRVYTSVLNTVDLQLDVIGNCFPTQSAAARWYNSHRSSFSTLEVFVERFKERFGGTSSDDRTCRNQLLSFRQRESDSVTQYYSSFCELIDDINALAFFLHSDQTTYKVDECMQVNKFVHGLCSSVRDNVERVHVRNPDMSLEELFQEAKLEEKLAKRKPRQNTTPHIRGVDTKPKCYFCKEPHLARDCPKIAAKKAAGTWKEHPPKK